MQGNEIKSQCIEVYLEALTAKPCCYQITAYVHSLRAKNKVPVYFVGISAIFWDWISYFSLMET